MGSFTHCFYAAGRTTIQDVAVQRDGQWFGGYSGDTEAQMLARTGAKLMPMDEAVTATCAAARAIHVKPPVEISAKVYMDALEVLPPSRWTKKSGIESFHVSERITGDLVDWYAIVRGRYFTFAESAALPHDRLVELVTAAAGL